MQSLHRGLLGNQYSTCAQSLLRKLIDFCWVVVFAGVVRRVHLIRVDFTLAFSFASEVFKNELHTIGDRITAQRTTKYVYHRHSPKYL